MTTKCLKTGDNAFRQPSVQCQPPKKQIMWTNVSPESVCGLMPRDHLGSAGGETNMAAARHLPTPPLASLTAREKGWLWFREG